MEIAAGIFNLLFLISAIVVFGFIRLATGNAKVALALTFVIFYMFFGIVNAAIQKVSHFFNPPFQIAANAQGQWHPVSLEVAVGTHQVSIPISIIVKNPNFSFEEVVSELPPSQLNLSELDAETLQVINSDYRWCVRGLGTPGYSILHMTAQTVRVYGPSYSNRYEQVHPVGENVSLQIMFHNGGQWKYITFLEELNDLLDGDGIFPTQANQHALFSDFVDNCSLVIAKWD